MTEELQEIGDILEITLPLRYGCVMDLGRIGIIADTHSNNALMLKAIHTLESVGVERIIHLGDICDSLRPEALDEAVEILKAHGVLSVLGNNEYSILLDCQATRLNTETLAYLRELPYTITMGGLCFTHSAPFTWPAATRRPIAEYLPFMGVLQNRILFRGHSHYPEVLEIAGDESREIPIGTERALWLDREKTYIITVGAVENGSFALFDTRAYTIQFVILSS